jgi:tRNA-splicing endonuclease subunit Sen54
MADEDEDISHLRAPEVGDFDPTEEAQDFRFLDKLTHALALTQQQLCDAS